jgi:hypothetical protein
MREMTITHSPDVSLAMPDADLRPIDPHWVSGRAVALRATRAKRNNLDGDDPPSLGEPDHGTQHRKTFAGLGDWHKGTRKTDVCQWFAMEWGNGF